MKKFIVIAVFLFTPLLIFSQNVNGRFSSSVYTFQRFDNSTDSKTNYRTFQTLALNVNKSKFALRTRVNLETNLNNSLEGDPRLRFYNLFLEGRKLWNVATIRIGRQSDYTGVGSGVYDGAYLGLKFNGVSASGYIGGNVLAYQKLDLQSWGDNHVASARVDITSLQNFKFTLRYIDKQFKSDDYFAIRLDENFDPIKTLIQKNSNQYKFVSGAVSYYKTNLISANVRYDYDLIFGTTSKFEAMGTLRKIKNLGISLYYNYREPRIRRNSIFSVFNYGNTQEIEGGLDYKLNSLFTIVGKFANVTYKEDNSQRLTVGLNSNYGNISYRKTFGYAGELDAISVSGAHSYLDGLITPSVGVSYTSYKLSKDSETNSVAALLAGMNYRPWSIASFDLQAQYMNNKIYKNDFRVLFKFNYWFNSNLN